MVTKANGRIMITFLLLMVFGLCACGTLDIGSEPTVARNEPVATATTVEQPLSTPVLKEAATTAVTVPTLTVTTVTVTTVAAPTGAPVNPEEEVVPETPAGFPTPVYYRNEETGISFSYPDHWTMEKEDNAVIFGNGSIRLQIVYRCSGEQVALWTRTGLSAGDFVVMDGQVSFLGQTLTNSGLVYLDKLKMVFYGGEPMTIVQAEAMEFTITLEDRGTDYLALDIPDEILAEAEAILTSFAADNNLTDPSEALLTYTNLEWGFALQYPQSWSVTKVNDEAQSAPSSRSVWLTKGTFVLVIRLRQIDERPPEIGTSVPAGDLETRGSVQLLGRAVPRQVMVFESKDKVVFYGQPGVFINAGSLEFAARLDDFAQVDYRNIELSQGVQDEADLILSSLEIFGRDG